MERELEVAEHAEITPDEFEPDPIGTGYLAQVHAFIPENFRMKTRKRRGEPLEAVYQGPDEDRVVLRVRRDWPRKMGVSGETAVVIEVGHPPDQWGKIWGVAPDPEEVAKTLLAILGIDR